jgi:hypothetical protein
MSEILTKGRKMLTCSDTYAEAENNTRSLGNQMAVSASL